MPSHVFPWIMRSPLRIKHATGGNTHPEINLQIPRTAKLPVPNLKCHRHLIILVQGLVKAFSLVGAHLDVVGEGGCEEAQEGGEVEDTHCGR